ILGNQYVVNLQSEDETKTNGNLAAALESLDEKVTTVLVVDDNNNDRRLMRKLLRRYKQYRMLEAKSGVEALEVVRDRKPDLIVSDLMMPDMDGFGLLKNIKGNPETADIPVVVVSAKTLSEIEDRTLLDKSESLWVKGDFSRRDLVDHIVETLGDKPISGTQPKPMLLQKTKKAKAAVLDAAPENMHIVVMIDSKDDDVEVIQKVLEATGKFAVYPAKGGRAGLKAVHEHQPDLIIMELELADMDGFTIAEKLSNDTTLNHIPVVILTGREVSAEDMMRMPADIETIYQKASLDRGKFLSIIEEKLT
ncbi:MAG: response regulator, partial [Chloroflexota bacterium]